MIKNVRQLMSLIKYDLKKSHKDFIRRFHKLCQKRGINFIKDALIFFTYNFYFLGFVNVYEITFVYLLC